MPDPAQRDHRLESHRQLAILEPFDQRLDRNRYGSLARARAAWARTSRLGDLRDIDQGIARLGRAPRDCIDHPDEVPPRHGRGRGVRKRLCGGRQCTLALADQCGLGAKPLVE